MQPLISVIIPAYNIENYIERCVKTVCEQTYENLEIIVIDDGSTDQTGKIIDRLAENDSRIISIHKENAGVSAARNTGLDIAKGEYIGFVDGDDLIEKDMYEILVSNAIKYEADISHCGYQMVFPNRVDYYYNTKETIIQDNYQGVYDLIKADKVEPGLCNKLYKKEIIGDSRLEEEIRINEDLLFNYILFKKARKSVVEDLPKYHYMVRENSASTSSININKIKDPLKVLEIMMNQETGFVYELLEKRYLYTLEKISTMKGLKVNREQLTYQQEKRRELRERLQSGNLQAQFSRKERIQMKLAVKSPFLYRIIHEMYAVITGSKNKYKI